MLAAIQIMVHANLFLTVVPNSDSLLALKKFWESGNPRVGEAGFGDISERHLESQHSVGSSQITGSEDHPMQRWVKSELEAPKVIRLPERISIMTNDPFRVVLFEDIEKFIFMLTTASAKRELVWACLKLLGCHVQRWDNDSAFYSWPVYSEGSGSSYKDVLCLEFADRFIRALADVINEDNFLVWFLQWEYGLYGAKYGTLSLKLAILTTSIDLSRPANRC